jgi:sugar phosphate isomerase/epimerase
MDYDLILHPDVYRQEEPLADLGARAVFENMDVNKPFGRTVQDMAEMFERFPSARLCLDVAHVWTNDRTLRLGFELLDAFGDRIRQIHLSGIEADGTHRPTTPTDLELYQPLLDRCPHVPWVLEAELSPDQGRES